MFHNFLNLYHIYDAISCEIDSPCDRFYSIFLFIGNQLLVVVAVVVADENIILIRFIPIHKHKQIFSGVLFLRLIKLYN